MRSAKASAVEQRGMTDRREYNRTYNQTRRDNGKKRDANASWRSRQTPEANRDRDLQYTYGISLAEYNAMLLEQGGRCAICRTDEPRGPGNTFQVDHDHTNGDVRGLLCHSCNTGIGSLRDDPALLRVAITYLESHALRTPIERAA
jgi:hypothetical protein